MMSSTAKLHSNAVTRGPLGRAGSHARLVWLTGIGVVGLTVWALRPHAIAVTPDAPVVWACGESLKVRPEAPPQERNSVWSASDKQVRLYSGRQEYVGFQVIVRGGNTPLKNVQVKLSAPRSASGETLDTDNIDLFQQHYLKVTVPSQWEVDAPVPEVKVGEYPVQMVPLRGPAASFDVPAGRNQPVWVDVYVPETQAPGDYVAEATVTAAGKPLATLPVRLTVWNFTLPPETHLKTMVPTGIEKLRWGFGLRSDDEEALRSLEDRFFQMAHQHRINFQPSEEDDVVSEWGGRYRRYLDGSAYKDRACAGVGPNLLAVSPGGEEQSEITRSIQRTMAWWKAQPKVIRDRTRLVCYVYDEPQDDEDFAAVASRSQWIRSEVGKELPLFLTTTKPGRVAPGTIDAWGELPVPEVEKAKARGEKIWATNHGYAGGPFVDTPGYAGRSQGWMAWKMGLDAWHFWDGCYWVDRQNLRGPDGKRIPHKVVNADPKRYLLDTWNDPLTFDQKRNPRLKEWIRLNGDGVLFYPGAPAGLQEPLASFTLKSLRRGFQDYEYLWLLQQKGKSADDLVSKLTPRPNEWSHDPDSWDQARIELGRRLEAVGR